MKLLIAGSGTDVGKTFTTCAIAQATGCKAYKPLVTGFREQDDPDTHKLIEAMGSGTVEEISPWRFTAPISPDMAAAREQRPIDFTALVKWSRERDGLIEGVGGVMVPIDATHTTLDWMRELGWPVLLVAGSYLGTLSHTLTAYAALKQAKLEVKALILNESAASPVPLFETKTSLARHLPVEIVAQPRVASYREATEIFAWARRCN